jgi:hypothetical protein
MQRRRDQVADPADRQHVLRREQPVITGQVHLPAQCHRFAQQGAAQPARRFRRNGSGEEHPRMRPNPRPRNLHGRRYAQRARCLQIRQRVQHRGRPVEVGRQPPAQIPVEQRVQADVGLPGKVSGQHLHSKRQVVSLSVRNPLAPAASDSGQPACLPAASVLPPDRVDVGTGGKQRAEQGDLRLSRRSRMNRARRRLEEPGLRRPRRRGLCRGQLQQPAKPRVLRPELREFPGHRRRHLAFGEYLAHGNYRKARRSGPDALQPAGISTWATPALYSGRGR